MAEDFSRRSFIKGASLGVAAGYFAAAGLSSTAMYKQVMPAEKLNQTDIGQIKGLKMKVVSETSWFENSVLLNDMKKAGGLLVNQYIIPWTDQGVASGFNGSNSGGFATYIEAELMDGSIKRLLLDTGWNPKWMEKRFIEEGVAEKLAKKQIDYWVISHEHFDHYWGLEAVLKYNAGQDVYVPKGFYTEGFDLLKGKAFPTAHLKNDYPHKGKVNVMDSSKVNPLFPGAALMTFDVPIICRVFGEQAFVFNVKDKGLVLVTGCCHMGIITYMETIRKKIKGGEKVYAVQGGLHISPFEDWDPQYDDLVLALNKYGVQHIGANHCTGFIAVEKMIAAKLPIVRGTMKNRTKRDIYLGNGDTMIV